MWRLYLIAVCLMAAAALAQSDPADQPPVGEAPPVRRPIQLEDVTPFRPRAPRTEADEDRLRALTLYAAARMKEHEDDKLEALRKYQRALRYDPWRLAARPRRFGTPSKASIWAWPIRRCCVGWACT